MKIPESQKTSRYIENHSLPQSIQKWKQTYEYSAKHRQKHSLNLADNKQTDWFGTTNNLIDVESQKTNRPESQPLSEPQTFQSKIQNRHFQNQHILNQPSCILLLNLTA